MKNHYMVMCKTLCKIIDLKKYSGVLHLVGCLSNHERKQKNIEMEGLQRMETCFC